MKRRLFRFRSCELALAAIIFLPALAAAQDIFIGQLPQTNRAPAGSFILIEIPALGTNSTQLIASSNLTGTSVYPPGSSLATIASASTAGTTLYLSQGGYDLGTQHIRLPHGVNLVGAGRDVTYIYGGGSIQTNGCIINPGSTSFVANLTIIGTNATVYQAPIGCAVYYGQAFTNATISNVRMRADSDGFYVVTNAACSWEVYNSRAEGKWDTVAVQGSAVHRLKFFNTILVADLQGVVLADAISAASATCLNHAGNGICDFYSCDFTATNANANQVFNASGTARANFYGCTWQAAGTNTAGFVHPTSGGFVQLHGTEITRTAMAGNTNIIGASSYARFFNYSTNAGLSFLADDPDEFTAVLPIHFTGMGGINVGSSNEVAGPHIAVGAAGGGFKVKEGSNATMGTGKLTSGAATVSTTAVATNSRIMLISVCTANAAQGLSASNIIAGTSFRVHSASGADANRFDWIIFNPAP